MTLTAEQASLVERIHAKRAEVRAQREARDKATAELAARFAARREAVKAARAADKSAPRERRPSRCSKCGETGHNRATCGRTAEENASWFKPLPAGERAALWVRDHGGSFGDAGARFGVSSEAVRLQWIRLFPSEPPPLSVERVDRQSRVRELADQGKTAHEIAAEVGIPVGTVYSVARRGRFVIATRGDLMRDQVEAQVAEVVAGNKTSTQAAIDSGLSHGRFYELLASRGISSRPGREAFARKDGRTPAASKLVDEGMSIADAARKLRVAPSCVSAYRIKQKRKETP